MHRFRRHELRRVNSETDYRPECSPDVSYWVFGGSGSSVGEVPIDPLNRLWAAFAFSFWSWLLLGWIPALVGRVIGGLYARRLDKTDNMPT